MSAVLNQVFKNNLNIPQIIMVASNETTIGLNTTW
jgi:hypothetical protein